MISTRPESTTHKRLHLSARMRKGDTISGTPDLVYRCSSQDGYGVNGGDLRVSNNNRIINLSTFTAKSQHCFKPYYLFYYLKMKQTKIWIMKLFFINCIVRA